MIETGITVVGIAAMILAGLVYANFLEWVVHRFVLHNRRLKWFHKFHFSEHHRNSRKNGGVDTDYLDFLKFRWSTRLKEVVSLLGLGLLHFPLWFVVPWVMVGATVGMGLYYGVHVRAHTNLQWARTWVPWHLDHHLGRDQHQNWNVTIPVFDHLFGTRVCSSHGSTTPHSSDRGGKVEHD